MDGIDVATLVQKRNAYVALLESEAHQIAGRLYSLGVEQVILFGSVARGYARMNSDLDLAVIWDTPLSRLDRTVTLYRRLGALAVPVDLVVLTPAEAMPARQTQFTKKIFAEGVRL